MKRFNFQISWLLSLLISVSSAFISCSDDEVEVNEWNSTYAYLQRSDYLVPNNSEWNLRHSEKGILGASTLTFRVKTQRVLEKDLTANLKMVLSGDFTDNIFELSNTKPVIKAGEMASEEITLSIPDFSALEQIHDALSFNLTVEIESIVSDNPNTFITNQPNLKAIDLVVNKAAYTETPLQNIESGKPDKSESMDRSKWNIQVQPGVEGDAGKLIDGNRGTDVALNYGGFWVTIDFQEVKTLTGICTQHWGPLYAPRKIEIFMSADGSEWKSCGTLSVSGGEHNIKFIYPIDTQYLKYQMLEVPDRVDITEFYVYQPQK